MARPRNKPLCGARKRQGPGCCSQVAGWGTDHVGEGRCKLHGGASRIKSGRWSGIQRESLREKLDALRRTDPLDLVDDLHLTRALTADFLERFEETRDALLAWHCAVDRVDRANVRPLQVLDLMDAARLLEIGSRMAQRLHKMRSAKTISLGTLRRLQEEMARIVARHVQDREALRAIARDWGEIRV